MSIIFDGREFSLQGRAKLAKKVEELKKNGIYPRLASIYLAEDAGSVLYTKLKMNAATAIGIDFSSFEIKQRSADKIIRLIQKLNEDKTVKGILVQKPSGKTDFSPKDWVKIVTNIDPKKDVDGLTPYNLGLLSLGEPLFIPATVKAVLTVIRQAKAKISRKNIVIIGASEILGKPLAMLLTNQGATVSLVHKKTKNIEGYCKKADILISAAGSPELIRGNMVKTGAIVIDVAAPKADVVTDEVVKKASFLSPVPGGVGPVTVLSLLQNLVDAASRG